MRQDADMRWNAVAGKHRIRISLESERSDAFCIRKRIQKSGQKDIR